MKKDVIVRPARYADLPRLIEIFNQSVLAHSTAILEPVTVEERRSWFEDHNSERYPILVAEKDSKILGYLYISPYRPRRAALIHTAEVSYFVDFDHHHQGVASQLMEACLKKCPGLGIKSLFAILLETNQPSINLLKKYGFQQWAYLPGVAEIGGTEVSQVYFGRKV